MLQQNILLALAAASATLAAPAPAPKAQGAKVAIPARRTMQDRDTGAFDVAHYFTEVNKVFAKYGSQSRVPESVMTKANSLLKKRAGTGSEALTDQVDGTNDELYYGPGTVGAKVPQTFTFDFDTGSSDIFVPGPNCGTAQGCTGTTKYSQTGQDEGNTTTITYGSGEVEGENYFDSVTIAGLTATHQNVISLSQAQGFSGSAANSLLGMAFQSIANSGQPPYFQTLIAENKVAAQEFAFYLGREKSNTQGASELFLGGTDPSKYTGALTQVPVSSQTYWQVALDDLTVNGTSAGPTTKGQAAIDTGTTIILAPTIAATAFFAKIPGSFPLPLISGDPILTLWAYPCSFSGTTAIGFAGKQFAINPLDFNYGSLTSNLVELFGTSQDVLASAPSGGYCISAVGSADLDPTENLYVVGDSFIKNWYSVFSFNNYKGAPSVSFAAAKGNQ